MSDSVISEIRRDHIMKLLRDGKRTDGRGLKDWREINIMTKDAHMNEVAGKYAGLDRVECRKAISSGP